MKPRTITRSASIALIVLTGLLVEPGSFGFAPGASAQISGFYVSLLITNVDATKRADLGPQADLYAIVTMDGVETTTDPIPNDAVIEPDWLFVSAVNLPRDSVDIRIEIWDADEFLAGNDDQLLALDLTLDLASCTVFGSIAGTCGNFSIDGPEPDATSIDFRIHIDRDRDGIPDRVEMTGELAALGADPCRQTVAVEVDYMDGAPDGHSHQPDPQAISAVVDAFDAAPLPAVAACPYSGFPKQSSGIDLLVVVDDPITEETGVACSRMVEIRDDNFDSSRAPWFHYNLWVHDLESGDTTSGVFCGDTVSDFIVSLGNWKDPSQNGTMEEQAGTFMHELGHALGLGHGGGDDVNYKPNYLSVMNYSFQTPWLTDGDGNPVLDFSRQELPTLNETALSESTPLASVNLETAWYDADYDEQEGLVNGPLDWDGDGIITISTDTFAQDINIDGVCVKDEEDDNDLDTTPSGDDVAVNRPDDFDFVATGDDRTCDTTASGDDEQIRDVGFTEPSSLTGHDDWANIEFRAAFAPGASEEGVEHKEITFEEALKIEQFWAEVRLELTNRSPEVAAGGPYEVDEGASLMLDATVSDPDGNPLTIAWTPATHLDDGTLEDPTFSAGDDLVETLTLTVIDSKGLSTSDTATVTVRNVAPVVDTGEDATINEGETVSATGSFTDPGADQWSATVDYGTGLGAEPLALNADKTFSLRHPYGDDGIYTVEVCVADDDDGAGCDSIDVTVSNLDPTVTLDTSGAITVAGGEVFLGRVGVEQSHRATATDPGSDDLTVTWNAGPGTKYYNDGAVPDPDPSPDGAYPFTVTDTGSAVFSTPGVHTLAVGAADDDDGSASASLPVLVMGDGTCASGMGFWLHQFSERGAHEVDDATLATYLDIISHASGVFSEQTPAGTIEEARTALWTTRPTMRDQATQQILAAWLNFASGSVGWNETIDTDGDGIGDATFHELVAEAETILLDLDATHQPLEHAKNLAEAVNQYDSNIHACG